MTRRLFYFFCLAAEWATLHITGAFSPPLPHVSSEIRIQAELLGNHVVPCDREKQSLVAAVSHGAPALTPIY